MPFPLPIAFVITELRPGGAERNLVALAMGLDREEFTPRVYSLAPRPPAGQNHLVRELEEAGIEVIFVGVEKPREFFHAVRRLRRCFAERPPALIQSFLFHANVVSALAARGMSIPVVAGLRVAQRERMRAFVERRLSRQIDRFVCVSHGVADVAARHGGLPPEKLVVIPNGVDPHRFSNVTPADLEQYGVASGKKVVLFIGRLEHQKGVDVLIDAAQSFLPHRPDVTLLIVGDGEERRNLARQAEASSLSAQVVFAPWQAEPLSIIAAADVVAIPSRWEGMPNVLMEAIALRRSVVVTDVEGVREVLSDQASKWIVPTENDSDLAGSINELLDGDSKTVKVVEANFRKLFAEFTLTDTVEAYALLYRSHISGVG